MRLVAFSDLHGDPRARAFIDAVIEKSMPDVVAFCGDITTFGPGSLARGILSGLRAKCVAVPGNCDPDEVIKEIEANCCSLHGRKAVIDGITFAGVGGGPMCHCNTPLELEEQEIFALLSPVISEGCVLITHAPPMGINDLTKNGRHLGSAAILELVKKHRPKLVLSGHVHEARGVSVVDGIRFANPGPLKEGHVAVATITPQSAEVEIEDYSSALKNL